MRDRLASVLTTWPFAGALATLVVNDAWLKSAYPGLVTGKLSDFAGIAVVALLLLAVWPGRALAIYAGLATAFAWWKSPGSEPFIQLVNAYAPMRIGRVVDFADLLALGVLPACSSVVAQLHRFALPWPATRRLLRLPIIAATVFGTVATSTMPPAYRHEDEGGRTIVHERIAAEAARHGLACDACPLSDGAMVYKGSGLMMSYRITEPRTVLLAIEPWPDSLAWTASACDKAASLRAGLKAVLAKQRSPLEYVEPQEPPEECR